MIVAALDGANSFAEALVQFDQRLHIPEIERLMAVSAFEPNCLHLARRDHAG